ncbi:WAP domain containing protein, SLPI-like [Trichuris trichiura]|uniref:WAP domain containing protein, SLPI-like n=1 Tax=Trichuris trichiura TaxID=36087 RepID=A0A077Z0H9_TRITR|nr:WAP domain containing protein, SLPI-like [Trichuris trichiura]
MHNGNCPPDAHYKEIVKTECDDDSVCEMDQRCCPVKDTMKCVATVNYVADVSQFKDGECPHVSEGIAKNATDCKVNQDCPAKDLCCQAKCVLPLPRRPPPKPGYCIHSTVFPVKMMPMCHTDYDCIGDRKCCWSSGVMDCTFPTDNVTFELKADDKFYELSFRKGHSQGNEYTPENVVLVSTNKILNWY